jgi:uncharacterized phage-associated protein
MSTYHAIARFFVERADSNVEEEFESSDLTHLKLQKLLYYAQGWALVKLGKPLFSNKIFAWQHGPVVVDAYHELKNFKSEVIDLEKFNKATNSPATILDDEVINLLTQVYDTYGIYNAWGLREMTHEEDPWKDNYPNGEITTDTLLTYFKRVDDEP